MWVLSQECKVSLAFEKHQSVQFTVLIDQIKKNHTIISRETENHWIKKKHNTIPTLLKKKTT